MQFTRVNSNPDETNGLLGVIDKVGLNEDLLIETTFIMILVDGQKSICKYLAEARKKSIGAYQHFKETKNSFSGVATKLGFFQTFLASFKSQTEYLFYYTCNSHMKSMEPNCSARDWDGKDYLRLIP